MHIRIRDWDNNFEQDRSKQWKSLKWVPIPNKQGLGYKKIMAQKNGAEIFGCWIALVEQGSLCNPRGDLSKYSLDDLSVNTLIPLTILKSAIDYIIQTLDWIEVIENLDINVNNLDVDGQRKSNDSSMLCDVILSNSLKEGMQGEIETFGKTPQSKLIPPLREWVKKYCEERKNGIDPDAFFDHYETRGWIPKGATKKMKNWQAAVRTWEGFKKKDEPLKNENFFPTGCWRPPQNAKI